MSTSYDEFLYPCAPQSQTHPELLATLAELHGLTPPPPEACSVLEIGCNNGSNLIPMAANEPESLFTGIDLAHTAISAASAWSAQLGLKNTEFVQADVSHWDPRGRQFDYILMHGVYSWVPPHIREALLELCRTSLSANGIAYISYNALPGCYFRHYVWDFLRFHTRTIADARQKIAAARELAAKMCDTLADGQQQAAIKVEFEHLRTSHDSVVLHDDLAEYNSPFHLTEFVADAEHHGLQYLCDARSSRDSVYDLDLNGFHLNGEEWLAARQYSDFVNARKFRSSLLCHAEANVDREIRPERVANLLAMSPAEPEAEQADGVQKFQLGENRTLSTNHTAAKRVLTELAAAWPGCKAVASLPLGELDPATSAALLIRLYDAQALELRRRAPHLVAAPGERPIASPLARMQLASGLQVVTNQRHISVGLTDALSRQFVLLMDGTRDRAALLRDLTDYFDPERPGSAERLADFRGEVPANRLDLAMMLDQRLDANLAGMARLCLLVG